MTDFEFDQEKKDGVNLAAAPTKCRTCGGDRYVMVRLRSPDTTLWMSEHKLASSSRSFYEEMAPCPDCNAIVVEYWRHDRTLFRSMDAGAARQALAQ